MEILGRIQAQTYEVRWAKPAQSADDDGLNLSYVVLLPSKIAETLRSWAQLSLAQLRDQMKTEIMFVTYGQILSQSGFSDSAGNCCAYTSWQNPD